jgi:hypothetical protein
VPRHKTSDRPVDGNSQSVRAISVGVLVALLTVGIFAVAENRANLPNLVVRAKYVLVTTYNGPDLTNPKVLPDDRQAVADV